jgi:predicted HTH domain antitoxin
VLCEGVAAYYTELKIRLQTMTYRVEIPDSVAKGLLLPESEIEPRLRIELAIALYAQGILSLGKASELAEMSRLSFGELLGKRNIPRHYSEENLKQDLDYARGE